MRTTDSRFERASPAQRPIDAASGSRPIELQDVDLLRPFYDTLESPLADLNASMMVAWRRPLRLQYCIVAGVLYVFAEWNGRVVLWGPPLGPELRLTHIAVAFDMLRARNPVCSGCAIMYVWDRYPLWNALQRGEGVRLVPQGREFIYAPAVLSSLRGSLLKKKRQAAQGYSRRCAPQVVPFAPSLGWPCAELLERWHAMKASSVPASAREKFDLERRVCADALRDGLPLEGVVAVRNGRVDAFSIGSPHGGSAFDCMFEKSDLSLPGAAAFIFRELARYCLGRYEEINAGEDWDVGYLARSKASWAPGRLQRSFTLVEANT